MSVAIDIRGIAEVQSYLAKLDDGQKATLQKAATAGARALKPFVVAAAPIAHGPLPPGRVRGALKRSISARQAARNRPAAVVTARPKIAFYRHMVIGGTKDHGPRKASVMVFQGNYDLLGGGTGEGAVVARRVRGTTPRPFMAEGFAAGQGAMNAAIDKVIDEALGSGK